MPEIHDKTSGGTGSVATTHPESLSVIQEALKGLQYGQVTVVVQDGIVVQVERTEKHRLRGRRT